jgi:hypothetical protein
VGERAGAETKTKTTAAAAAAAAVVAVAVVVVAPPDVHIQDDNFIQAEVTVADGAIIGGAVLRLALFLSELKVVRLRQG